MLNRRVLLAAVCVAIIGGALLTEAISQDADSGGRRERRAEGRERRGRGGTAEERAQRMQEFRQRMQERLREQLGSSETEWKVLGPQVEKVQTLARQAGGRFGAFGFGGRGRGGRRGARPEGAPQREQSQVEKKTEALQKLLEDEGSNVAAVKAALGALRVEREKMKKELALEKKKLQSIVTIRQEARLVLMGLLD